MNAPRPETVERLAPGIRRVLAPNPSPMTYWGTNSYIIGEGEVAVIDPGPAEPAHLRAILDALAPGERITHILVTHSHLDHSALAGPLSQATGAPVLAFGDSRAGRSEVMERLARAGLSGGGEGVDAGFAPHERLRDGQVISGPGWRITALWTPGHFGNHLCFALGDALFTGDHVMGWASSLVSPPDGDLTAFMASTRRLAARRDRIYYPGHGAPVERPGQRIRWLLEHRRSREAALLEALAGGPATLAELAARVYTDIPARMRPMAERNAFAHLVDLVRHSRVRAEPELSLAARFSRV